MKFCLIILLLSIAPISLSQKKYSLFIKGDDYKKIKKNYTTQFKDSLSRETYIHSFRYTAIKKGYLLASIDSSHYHGQQLTSSFYLGPKFKQANIRISKDDLAQLKKISNINERLITRTDFSPTEIAQLLSKIQQDFENNGFPFVQVSLQDVKIEDQYLSAEILIKKGPEIKWTKINLKGEQPISQRLLSSYIHIKIGQKFNQSDVQQISNRLLLIPFIEEIKPAELLFTTDGVELYLYLKSKPVSLANGVIGLQPNAATGKMMFTGDIRLKLVNIIKKAETLDLNWKSLQYQTQSLNALVNIPNLLRSPFGIDFQFSMYKRDTSFLELKPTFGIQYALNNGSFIKVFYRNTSSSILRGGQNNPLFAKIGNLKTNYYGIGWNAQTVDYLPNPSRGYTVNTSLSVGLRKTKDSSNTITQTTYLGELEINYFIPIAKRHVLRIANQSSFYNAPTYFQNEAFRFGGQLKQRGFNEEEIYATTRTTFTLEYRFQVDKNSFAFIFYDQSFYENNIINYYKDNPFGIGVGFTFGTRIGAFSISYALGKQFNNPMTLKDGKIHFGYIAYF